MNYNETIMCVGSLRDTRNIIVGTCAYLSGCINDRVTFVQCCAVY